MALNIKSLKTERIVRELAKRTGLSITEAVHRAATDTLRRMETDAAEKRARLTPEQLAKLHRIAAICKEAAALPVLDDRTPEEIVGYDDKGMW